MKSTSINIVSIINIGDNNKDTTTPNDCQAKRAQLRTWPRVWARLALDGRFGSEPRSAPPGRLCDRTHPACVRLASDHVAGLRLRSIKRYRAAAADCEILTSNPSHPCANAPSATHAFPVQSDDSVLSTVQFVPLLAIPQHTCPHRIATRTVRTSIHASLQYPTFIAWTYWPTWISYAARITHPS